MAENQEVLTQKVQAQGDLVRKLKAAKESSDKVSLYKSIMFYLCSLSLKLHHSACKLLQTIFIF